MVPRVRDIAPWVITTVIALIIIAANDNVHVTAIRGKTGDAIALCAYPVRIVVRMATLWKRNEQLYQKYALDELMLIQRSKAEEENTRLRQMLGFKTRVNYSMTVAEVIGYSLDPGVRGLLINVGSNDGIKVNQGVIVPEGAVGRIYRVGWGTAAVQLITDDNIGIAGRLLKGREGGITRALPGGRLSLDGIASTAEVNVGDTVLTSGLDGVFPPGLLIGVVDRVHPTEESGWLLQIGIKPAVKYSSLEELFVVTNADEVGSDSGRTLR